MQNLKFTLVDLEPTTLRQNHFELAFNALHDLASLKKTLINSPYLCFLPTAFRQLLFVLYPEFTVVFWQR